MGMGVRRVLAGFLAGASSVAGILAILVLLLFIAGIWSFLRDVSSRAYGDVPFWRSLGSSLLLSFGAIPAYFWSARWGMFWLGILGIGLAMLDTQTSRIRRPWRDRADFIATLGLICAIVIYAQYGNQESVSVWAAGQPGLPGRDQLLAASDAVRLFTAALIALGISYVIWVAWNYWYDKWAARLKITRPQRQPVHAPAVTVPPAEDWREYQARLARLKSSSLQEEMTPVPVVAPFAEPRSWGPPILGGLAATTVLVYLALRVYHSVGPAAEMAGLWVTRDAPRNAVELPLTRAPRQVVISNLAGNGSVDIRLSPREGVAPVRTVNGMPFSGSPTRYETSKLDLVGLPPGNYRLDATLRQGDGGFLEYVAVYGGGLPGRLAAVTLGLATGAWLALCAVLLLDMLSGTAWLETAEV